MRTTHYKDREAILFENESLSAVVIPNPGGKLASLTNKKNGFEYLVQREAPNYKTRPYGELYVDAECSGFDDMFPTIDPCYCEQSPWLGAQMPCHGEVWSLPWSVSQDNGALTLAVDGVRFPYRLEKTIRLDGGALRYDYRLTNKTPFDFDYLWAGHMMLNVFEGTRFDLPADCRDAVTVLSDGSRKFGDLQKWPDFLDRENRLYRADRVRPRSARAFEKFYFTQKLKKGFCRLIHPNGCGLLVEFSAETVPYLGLLVNEESWDGLYNAIVEPCSVGFDRPDTAKRFNQISTLPGGGVVRWGMNIIVE